MTFSIVGRCARTGRIGVALATGLPAAGSYCVQAAGGAGAVATQGYTNPYLAPRLLDQLRDGATADTALAPVVSADPDASRRQVIVIDSDGRTAAHTGADTFLWHGQIRRHGVAAAANMVPSERVIESMVETFAERASEELWWRLARALAAGEAAGSERLRPCRSAVVRVVETEDYPLLEARVDASDRPIAALLEAVATIERDGLPFTRMLPTRAQPMGSFDLDDLDRHGLLPAPGEIPGDGASS